MLKIAVIIPVKTFSRAKSRLDLPEGIKVSLCKMMLEELLHTLSMSPLIEKIIVVTGDPAAAKIAEEFSAAVVWDIEESGVNMAVTLADDYIKRHGVNATVVLPQDIPFTKIQDIDFLLKIQIPPNFVTVVPSRKFDGTNALVRMPPDIMTTSYDQDSYRKHADAARKHTRNPSILFVRRIMMDIDDIDDLKYALEQNEKPELCNKIRYLVSKDGMDL